MKRFPLFGPSAVAVLILGGATGVIIMAKNFKFGLCVVAGAFIWAIIMMMAEWTFSSGHDKPSKDVPAEAVIDPVPVDEIITPQRSDSSLEYLAGFYVSSPTDKLASLSDSICQRATRLLEYRKEDGVIGEILETYRMFIEQYVARAAELVKKYRVAQAFLDKADVESLYQSISQLQADIRQGEVSLQKTLDEKIRTRDELISMRESQVLNERELREIDATLEAMETIAVSAATNNADAKYIGEQLQQTISTTSRAIKETLCAKGSWSST